VACEAERVALKALQRKLREAQKRLEDSPAQKNRDLAESQIKHMDELVAKYKDTRGYKKRIKEWKAEKRKNEKKLDDAIETITPLTRDIHEIGNELGAADAALDRCLQEERKRAERPHINTGEPCWCGERGMHAAGTPR
jgi:16S rRNA C967 or C1407 C5-methylase (RsmB/RsmF family)